MNVETVPTTEEAGQSPEGSQAFFEAMSKSQQLKGAIANHTSQILKVVHQWDLETGRQALYVQHITLTRLPHVSPTHFLANSPAQYKDGLGLGGAKLHACGTQRPYQCQNL